MASQIYYLSNKLTYPPSHTPPKTIPGPNSPTITPFAAAPPLQADRTGLF
jgi:hypothetical protein